MSHLHISKVVQHRCLLPALEDGSNAHAGIYKNMQAAFIHC